MYFRMASPIFMFQGKTQLRRPAHDRADKMARRRFGLDHLDRLLIGYFRAHAGAHKTRADRRDGDAPSRESRPKGFQVGDQGRFGCGIRDHPGETAISGHAGDADDVPPFSLDHAGQNGFDAMSDPDHVDVERLAQPGCVEIGNERERADGGTGNQDFNRADLFCKAGDRFEQSLAVRHVRSGVGNCRTLFFERLGQFGECRQVAIDQCQRRSLLGQGDCCRVTDAVSGARQQHGRHTAHRPSPPT